jgi:hypothetical protein
MLSVLIDLDWISYKYFPDGDLAYYNVQRTSLIWAAVWYSLLTNMFVKLLCLSECLKARDPTLFKKMWGRVGKCLISSRIPDDLGAAVKDKVT